MKPTDARRDATAGSSAVSTVADSPGGDDSVVQRTLQTIDRTERLAAAAGGSPAPVQSGVNAAKVPAPVESPESLLNCLTAIVQGATFHEAIDGLTKKIAFECPDRVVRVAIGRRRIDRFFDASLGWLPRNNEIRGSAEPTFDRALSNRNLARQFDVFAAEDSDGIDDGIDEGDDAYRTVDLSRDDAGDRDPVVLLLMRPAAEARDTFVGPTVPHWLSEHRGHLATALASRPRIAVPSFAAALGSRPAATLLIVGLLLIGLGLWPTPYAVRCQATLTPLQPRTVAAPVAATLLSTEVMPGDEVHRGQTLVQLDGRPLRIELRQIRSEIAAAEKDASIALADGEVGASQKAKLLVNKLMHRSRLIEDRLRRLVVAAPVDGVVIGEDLRRSIGTPLSLGQPLMEIAPLGRLAAEIAIDEFEINSVDPDASVRIRFDAAGGQSLRTSLDSIDPSSTIRDESNVFIGRTTLENDGGRLRPGMTGRATVYGPVSPLAWSIIRPVWERGLWAVGY